MSSILKVTSIGIFFLLATGFHGYSQTEGKRGEPMTVGQGITLEDIESLVVKDRMTGTAYGTTLKVYPYLLLKDGSLYSRPDISPHDLDVKTSKIKMPDRWGTYSKNGNTLSVQFAKSKSPKVWKKWLKTRPALEGETLSGTFKAVSPFGGSNVHRFNTLILEENGQFTWRYFYKYEGGFIPHKEDREIKGTYTLKDYTIQLDYASGQSERFLFAKYVKDGDGFIIGLHSLYPFQIK